MRRCPARSDKSCRWLHTRQAADSFYFPWPRPDCNRRCDAPRIFDSTVTVPSAVSLGTRRLPPRRREGCICRETSCLRRETGPSLRCGAAVATLLGRADGRPRRRSDSVALHDSVQAGTYDTQQGSCLGNVVVGLRHCSFDRIALGVLQCPLSVRFSASLATSYAARSVNPSAGFPIRPSLCRIAVRPVRSGPASNAARGPGRIRGPYPFGPACGPPLRSNRVCRLRRVLSDNNYLQISA